MLEVRGVTKRYRSIRALEDVSLRVDGGEIVAVVGENGAGKSTLVRCIARALRPDAGSIVLDGVELRGRPRDAIERGVSVVWQDLALCDNLDVTANLFLGRELDRRLALDWRSMEREAGAVFADLGVESPGLDRRVERLSGGQRQLVAIARAMLDRPRVLVLDEPTASLGVTEAQSVLEIVRRLRARGVAILLVSHQLDAVFDIADRIVALRHGRVVADLPRSATHPDDLVALISGVDVDTTAGQQLRRVHSLAEQLSDADERTVLPLTVSSLSSALSTERLAIYVVDNEADPPVLRRSASLHLPATLASELDSIAIDESTFVGRAAVTGSLVIAQSLLDAAQDTVAAAAAANGLAGAWAAPIVGQAGTSAVIVGFHLSRAPLQDDQIRLLELFSTMAGSAIERGRLVETLRRRNQALEGLHGVLETLAGPDLITSGIPLALDALCRGVGSGAAALYVEEADAEWSARATSAGLVAGGPTETTMRSSIAAVEAASVESEADDGGADPSIVVARFEWSRGRAALACRWSDGTPPSDAGRLVSDAANSFRLAMEREATVEVEREAAALQRSRELERGLTLRLGHELRTPLTAIRGFASTMLQPDVEWPDAEKERFLNIIERESGRMSRLVAQIFDDTAIESGVLRLDPHYCDLVAIVAEAAAIAAPVDGVILDVPSTFTVWGDRDRLEQVFVNLIANAFRHNPEGTKVRVRLLASDGGRAVLVEVADDGVGVPSDVLDYLNGGRADRSNEQGLGLRLVKGLVVAHGGTVAATIGDGTTIVVELPVDRPDPV